MHAALGFFLMARPTAYSELMDWATYAAVCAYGLR